MVAVGKHRAEIR